MELSFHIGNSSTSLQLSEGGKIMLYRKEDGSVVVESNSARLEVGSDATISSKDKFAPYIFINEGGKLRLTINEVTNTVTVRCEEPDISAGCERNHSTENGHLHLCGNGTIELGFMSEVTVRMNSEGETGIKVHPKV